MQGLLGNSWHFLGKKELDRLSSPTLHSLVGRLAFPSHSLKVSQKWNSGGYSYYFLVVRKTACQGLQFYKRNFGWEPQGFQFYSGFVHSRGHVLRFYGPWLLDYEKPNLAAFKIINLHHLVSHKRLINTSHSWWLGNNFHNACYFDRGNGTKWLRHWMLYEKLSTRRCKVEMGNLMLTL